MKKRNWLIVIFVVLTIAGNGLYAQQKELASTSFQDDIEKLMLEEHGRLNRFIDILEEELLNE